ncbi:IS200/IS605 family transposase [Alkaliphilus sp. B6464]|uniref:IS200/IS605 family transposase n=1 Tax=Alkaliphilus sp. B6464 TaxID=2731219 RepID=UPI001BACD969|nr:IS200/IS605 family transposase [Alkaliphilus sp. B6464]QUH20022.1 IS200/IS605 family transposase [Alkaliphilus sp. B6464]
MDNNSLTHTVCNCKYSVVFVPKYRIQPFYGKHKRDIGGILRTLCDQKEIEIFKAIASADYLHMVISIPSKYSISDIVKYLKRKSSILIFDKNLNLKNKYGNKQFWCIGYYINTVEFDENLIKEYVKKQIQNDISNQD